MIVRIRNNIIINKRVKKERKISIKQKVSKKNKNKI